jgi:predicted regulator of Ras-like GTPase activity (Roadblock/LC7/MglB family)
VIAVRDMVIEEADAARIGQVLTAFLSESGALEALLIDRSGQLLAMDGVARAIDTVAISALAAAAFSSTSAMAQLLGETEFTVLFHEGVKQSIHVSTVDEEAILLAIFDERTTIGMVRLFGKDASRATAAILAETRRRPKRVGEFATPLRPDEMQPAWEPPSARR